MEPQAYAFYRSCLESGRALHAAWKATGAVRLDTKQLLDVLSEVIPEAVIGAVTSVGEFVDDDAPDPTPEQQALIATKAFGAYPALRVALDAAAGKTYNELVKDAPGVADGDLEWWAVALSTAGFLWWIGKLAFRGAVVAKIVSAMFVALAGYELITAKTEEGKNVIKQAAADAANAVASAGKSVGALVWWTLAGVSTIGLVGLGLYLYNAAQDDKEKRRLRRELGA